MRPPRQDIIRSLGLAACALACLATSAPPPRPPRPFLAWQLDRTTVRSGCLDARAWVSKSGREGVGVTIRLENVSEVACEVAVTGATFTLAGASAGFAPVAAPMMLDAHGAPAVGRLAPHELRLAYVGFAFDNAATAEARLDGTFTAAFTVDGLAASLAVAAHQGAYQAPEPLGR